MCVILLSLRTPPACRSLRRPEEALESLGNVVTHDCWGPLWVLGTGHVLWESRKRSSRWAISPVPCSLVSHFSSRVNKKLRTESARSVWHTPPTPWVLRAGSEELVSHDDTLALLTSTPDCQVLQPCFTVFTQATLLRTTRETKPWRDSSITQCEGAL